MPKKDPIGADWRMFMTTAGSLDYVLAGTVIVFWYDIGKLLQ